MMADGDACVKISSDRDGFIVKEKIIRNRKWIDMGKIQIGIRCGKV